MKPKTKGKVVKVGSKKSKAKIPAKGFVAQVEKKMRVAPPKAKPNGKETAKKIPQRKPNKAMGAMEMLGKGMQKLNEGRS